MIISSLFLRSPSEADSRILCSGILRFYRSRLFITELTSGWMWQHFFRSFTSLLPNSVFLNVTYVESLKLQISPQKLLRCWKQLIHFGTVVIISIVYNSPTKSKFILILLCNGIFSWSFATNMLYNLTLPVVHVLIPSPTLNHQTNHV
jgi:flagellar biosynthesis protein FlhB